MAERRRTTPSCTPQVEREIRGYEDFLNRKRDAPSRATSPRLPLAKPSIAGNHHPSHPSSHGTKTEDVTRPDDRLEIALSTSDEEELSALFDRALTTPSGAAEKLSDARNGTIRAALRDGCERRC